MSYPKTIEDAKAHINQIRASKGLDGSYTNTSDLQNALVMYEESCRPNMRVLLTRTDYLTSCIKSLRTSCLS